MRFALDDDAVALRDAVWELLARETGDAAWRKLTEACGDVELAEDSLVPVVEEIGYAGLDVPVPDILAALSPHGGDPAGILVASALLTGLSRRMLDMTVAYVKQRHQFGVPVGSFQAIKHKLADALVAIEFTRPLVLAAAWAQASRAADAIALTSAAKARASDTARMVAKTAIQCHGAMGYTTEYELHRFAKQAWALAASFGTAHEHRAWIAREIGARDG